MEGKYLVAAAGIAGVTAIEVANILTRGPDSTIVAAVVGAITAIVAYAFGRATTPSA